MSILWDVLVVGAGPAGSALAIRLAAFGLSVCLVERDQACQLRPGECLSPEAVPALTALGHADLLDDPACARYCAGVQSIWMGEAVAFRDYFAERSGGGFFLEREVFDAKLRARARQHGVTLVSGVRVTGVHFGAISQVQGVCADAPWTAQARFVVDASGKSASIARLGGARRQRLSRQVAVAACLPKAAAALPTADWLLIEADASCWWSAATTVNGRRHLVRFFPGGDRQARSASDLAAQLAQTRLISHFASADELPGVPLQVFDAGCSALDRVASEHWLAVGEAALAFDPVSSQGLAHAFGATAVAAHAIQQRVCEGRHAHLERYQQQTRITLSHSLQGLARHYAQCRTLAG